MDQSSGLVMRQLFEEPLGIRHSVGILDNGDFHFHVPLTFLIIQSGTVIKFDNLDQNNLLANQTPSLSSRDTLS